MTAQRVCYMVLRVFVIESKNSFKQHLAEPDADQVVEVCSP